MYETVYVVCMQKNISINVSLMEQLSEVISHEAFLPPLGGSKTIFVIATVLWKENKMQ